MQREKGKVPTNINKDMVAAGSQNIQPKKDWTKIIERIEERKAAGKSEYSVFEKNIETKSLIKEISKTKVYDRDR